MFRRLTMFLLMLVLLLAPLLVLTIWPFGSWGGGGGNGTEVLLWDGDEPLLTMRQAQSSIFLCGSVGSGKTSSQGNIERALFGHPSRPGGVWCCVKADECERALRILESVHRLDDVVLWGPRCKAKLDVARWELRQRRGGSPEQFAQLLDWLGLVATKTDSTHGGEGIWAQYTLTTIYNAVVLLELAGYNPSLNAIYDVINSVPFKVLSGAELEDWKTNQDCGIILKRAEERSKKGELTAEQQEQLLQVRPYFQRTLPQCGPEMRGSIVGCSVAPLAHLQRMPYASVFGSVQSTCTPADPLDGKIFLFHPDWSVLVAGTPAQVIQAMLCRTVATACMQRPEGTTRPAIFVRDEFGHVIGDGSWEAKVLSVSRSHQMVFLDATQDVNTAYTFFGGGEKGKQETLSFINNHATKILFACSDNDTCRLFSSLCGMKKEFLINISKGGKRPDQELDIFESWLGLHHQPQLGMSEQYQPEIRPEFWSGGFLRTGGPHNDWTVDAVMYRAGHRWSNGKAFRLVSFKQVL